MLLDQAIVGSLISVLFIAVPTVQSLFWLLSALLVQLYLLMYILLFASAWRLRFTQPDRPRAWRVPGGKAGIAIVSTVGIAFATAAFLVGFIPPSSLTELTTGRYLGVLCSALAASLGIPLLLMVWRKVSGRADDSMHGDRFIN